MATVPTSPKVTPPAGGAKITIQNGKLAPAQGCFSLAATPTNHLAQIRAYERAKGL